MLIIDEVLNVHSALVICYMKWWAGHAIVFVCFHLHPALIPVS